MASISKIRYTNVVYENGGKRYNDEVFTCAGHNTAILLENGGGKTVFIQAALQAILPHTDLGERKAKETFVLEGQAAHIAIEWILSEKPRRYGVTAVTLYNQNNELKSYKYVYEYGVEGKEQIEAIPFTREEASGLRAATRTEMQAYYQMMSKENLDARVFSTTREFHQYIEDRFKIIPEEWRSITVINGGEGSVEAFFDGCKTTADLVDKLLLPTVEEGLVGKGSEAFAGTFESQREHFNKHKQLERSIAESEKIKQAIESYTADFSAYHDKKRAYQLKKEEAKALWQLIEKQEEHVKEQLEQLAGAKKQLEDKKAEVQGEEAFIEVQEARETLGAVEASLKEVEVSYKTLKDKQKAKEVRRHLLKLARFDYSMEEALAKVKLYEEQLQLVEEDTEVEALTEALEVNSGEIKSYFEDRLVEIERDMGHSQREQDGYKEESMRLREAKQASVQVLQMIKDDTSKKVGKLEHQEKQLKQLKMLLVAEGATEDISLQQTAWLQRIDRIDMNQHEMQQTIKNLLANEQQLHQTIDDKANHRTQVLEKLSASRVALEQIEKSQTRIIEQVQKVLPVFKNMTSLYLKPHQVLTALEEQVEKITLEKEEALLVERHYAHFLENYKTHDFFTAEPLVEVWVDKWAPDFTFLQTGTSFRQAHRSEAQEGMQVDPRWVTRMVVADEEVDRLFECLIQEAGKMTYPVSIMRLSEAKEHLEAPESEGQVVYPTEWYENSRSEVFEERKKETDKALELAILFRQEKEKALRLLEQALEQVRVFLELNPHDMYTTLREETNQLKRDDEATARSLEEAKEQLAKELIQQKTLTDTLAKEKEEKTRLGAHVEKARTYLEHEKECAKDRVAIVTLGQTIKEQEDALYQLSREELTNEELYEEARETLATLRTDKLRIQEDKLYQEVKAYAAVPTSESISYLREKQEELQALLANRQKGRQELETLLKHHQKVYEDNKRSYEEEQADYEDVTEEVPVYRQENDDEMLSLGQDIRELKEALLGTEVAMQQTRTQFDKSEQIYETKKKAYELQYGNITDWGIYTPSQKKLVAERLDVVLEQERATHKQWSGLEKELKVILEHKQQMDKKDAIYGYCAPEVKVGVLPSHVAGEMMYELKVRVLVGELLDALEKLHQAVHKGEETIREQRAEFKLYCQREIRDSKLRNMAVQGITQKEDYEDLVVWKDNIVERIDHTLGMLERDLVDQDQQISQFIIHLYAYLKSVVGELGEIPKNTGVQTEEGWKTIYEFTIPTWQEESGKEKIRQHIYGLLDAIEGSSFLDDTGKEDVAKIKRYIKEQFKLRNLLKVVMGNDVIRVKCRKVSNMNDISSQKYSWETSNKWSGGEKWSKNMALYLGILKYLAEKKQNLQDQDQKISRAVILDNPFGKASSGHVLEPVFFIARQLGFQIIALTAHSEGDFIRRYFPIVYSCKLRSTLDQQTAIFSKEQEIKKAYFMDNDPVALSILGSNQMSLFL